MFRLHISGFLSILLFLIPRSVSSLRMDVAAAPHDAVKVLLRSEMVKGNKKSAVEIFDGKTSLFIRPKCLALSSLARQMVSQVYKNSEKGKEQLKSSRQCRRDIANFWLMVPNLPQGSKDVLDVAVDNLDRIILDFQSNIISSKKASERKQLKKDVVESLEDWENELRETLKCQSEGGATLVVEQPLSEPVEAEIKKEEPLKVQPQVEVVGPVEVEVEKKEVLEESVNKEGPAEQGDSKRTWWNSFSSWFSL